MCSNKLSSNNSKDVGIYKINCLVCEKFYIGETGRPLNKRLYEHKNAVKNNCISSALAHHVHTSGHNFDFQNAKLIHYCNDVDKRHVVESACILKFRDKCINLNNGFSPIDEMISNQVYKNVFHNNRL